MDAKGSEITTLAIEKSVIESGASPGEWDSLIAEGIALFQKYKHHSVASPLAGSPPPAAQQEMRKAAPAANVGPGEFTVAEYEANPTKNPNCTNHRVFLKDHNGKGTWCGTINDDDGSILSDAFNGGHRVKADIERNGKFVNVGRGTVELVGVGADTAADGPWA